MITERDLYSVLVVAKKVDDAINEGLAALNATLDEVNVEVVDAGGFLRKAKVRLTLEKEEPEVKKEEPEKKVEPPAEKPEKAEKPIKTEKSDKVEKTEKPEKPEKAEKSEKPVKTDKAEKPEKATAQKPAKKADKPEKPAKTEKVEKPSKPENAEKEENVEKGDKVKKVEKPTREEEIEALNKACGFIKEVVALMGFTAEVKQDESDPELINIDAPAGDDSLIIGRHGETLSALSYLAETGARAEKTRVNVTVDCNGYRGRRAASLTAMAHRRADEAVNKGRRIKLDAMERIDRRTVHNALTDDDRVTTASEGKEPYRFVVIIPKDERKGGKRRGGRDRHNRGRSEKPVEPSESDGAEE
ncbi:MAG: KH domain-containing protein [Clostridiales bacterium]|nr:KH domain-containing protein [Clostridiales bacterium]